MDEIKKLKAHKADMSKTDTSKCNMNERITELEGLIRKYNDILNSNSSVCVDIKGFAFAVKPKALRSNKNYIEPPIKQDPALSAQARTVETPFGSFTQAKDESS